MPLPSSADTSKLEKTDLEIVFIPILCSAPLIYAHSHGYFERHGLQVTLVPSTGWSGIKELMAHGFADAAHFLSPMPLACHMGIDGMKSDIRLAAIQNVNGQALTLAKKHLGITDVRDMKGFTFGIPYSYSMHYYLLCHYLSRHGLDPHKDVSIDLVAPPRMPYYLKKGWVDGIFAPEPFNQIPVLKGTGFIHILSRDIWPGHPCCGFAIRQDFMERYPNTYRAMLKSVLEAELALHQADEDGRAAIAREICDPRHLNQEDTAPVEMALTGVFPDGKGGQLRVPDRIDFIPHPWPEYGKWMLSQMQRWGQLPGRIDYDSAVETVFQAESGPLAESVGFSDTGPKLDGVHPFTGEDPFSYMKAQPFCAHRETPPERRSYDLSPAARERLMEILRHQARITGGRTMEGLDVTGDDEIGLLEQSINEMIMNMRFSREALAEGKERIEEQMEETVMRAAELEKEIVERRRIENDLRTSEEKFRGLAETLKEEIAERKRAEEEIKRLNEALESSRKKREGKYLTFELANEIYGIGIMKVREIIRMMPITPLPEESDSSIRGVINLRNRVVPIVDLRRRFGIQGDGTTASGTDRACIVVVDVGGDLELGEQQIFGLLVDAVAEVQHIRGDDIEDPPRIEGQLETSHILGMAMLDDGVKVLLDIDRILGSPAEPSEFGDGEDANGFKDLFDEDEA